MTDAESSLTSRETLVDAPPNGGALPEGAVTIAIGLIIAGVATYAFFRVGASALGGDEEFAPIAALWFAMFALAPGFFLPIEQELGRALAHRRARPNVQGSPGEGSRREQRGGCRVQIAERPKSKNVPQDLRPSRLS